MNKYYDEFKQMIDAYLAKHGKQVEFESNLYETSLNDADSKNIYDNTRKDIDVISMDDIAHKPYREIRYPESVKEEDSISTNDAFVISEENEWYFIEFKDQTLNKTKDSVSKKAYSNWHMLLDIIKGDEPYYPVNDEKNGALYQKYKELADQEEKVIFGGRLGEYKYYDMDAVIAAALELCEREMK